MSPSLSHCRGPASPFKASLKPQQGLTSRCEEEKGTAETDKQGQTEKFGLIDLRETLKALDDFSEIRWLTDLLPLCLECQSFMSMGNQQGMKIKPHCHGNDENRDALPKSPRFQIPRKRRRRAEGLVYSQHNLKMTPSTLRVPSKARRLTRLQITSSPTFGEWDSDEDRQIICTPASRRKRVLGSPQELQPSWRVKPPDALSADFRHSKNRDDLSVKEKCALPDSDTDLSEYDNDMYSICISPTSLEPTGKREDNARDTEKARIIRPESDQKKKAEGGEEKSSQWMYEEMGRKAAAQRVMGKIEELEGIIRRVSLSSSDWIREEEAQFILDGCVDEERHRCRAEFGSQNKGCSEDKPQLIEEFHALGEALSQSLRQVLKVEGPNAEREPFTEAKETSSQPNNIGSTRKPLNLSSHSYPFAFNVPSDSSSPSLSAGGETSPVPTPSLSAILDVSQRTSSSFKGMSPILSPLFTSSQHSLPLSQTDHHEKDISDCHRGWISSVGDSLFPQWAGGCRSSTTASGGTENDGRKTFSQENLRLSEQNQTQTFRCTSETDDLLSSGNYATYATTTRSYMCVMKCN